MAAQALAGSLGLTVRLPVTGPPPTVKQLQLAAGAAESVVDGVTLAPSSPLVPPHGGPAAIATVVAPIPRPHRDEAAEPRISWISTSATTSTVDPEFAAIGRTALLNVPRKPSVAGRGRRLPSRRPAGARAAASAERPVSVSLEVSTI